MSKYLLKLLNSNYIESVIEWDGETPLSVPQGYTLELLSDDTTDFINYVFTSSADDSFSSNIEISDYNSGFNKITKFEGYYVGDLSGSITWNGRTLQDILDETDYGYLYQHRPFTSMIKLVATPSFMFEVSGTVLMSEINANFNKKNIYNKTLQKVLENENVEYIVKFKQKSDPYSEIYYNVNRTELVSASVDLVSKFTGENFVYSANAYRLHGNPIYDPDNFFENFPLIEPYGLWNVDFQFMDDPQVGKFIGEHTGSFTGSFEGYAELTGSFFGAYKGLLDGTASNSVYALTASFAQNASSIEVIQKSKNWIKPSWAKTIRVTCVGGGGGGGAAPASEDIGPVTGGGGGGGGTITVGEFDADTLPDVITITVGAGGLGGTYISPPSNGGNTHFGKYLIARGGNAGFNGTNDTPYVWGGSSIANVNYLNTGAGGGGAGTIDGYMQIAGNPPYEIFYASIAPPLPMQNKYLFVTDLDLGYYYNTPTPIPAVIAPTGGGGGLGYDASKGGRQGGSTQGGKINAFLDVGYFGGTDEYNYFQSLSPEPYASGSDNPTQYWNFPYPAFNTTVGLGGRGGRPAAINIDLSSAVPTEGTIYGGGGGGAYGGGIVGRYAVSGDVNGTPYNFGANGARGVVVIISEA